MKSIRDIVEIAISSYTLRYSTKFLWFRARNHRETTLRNFSFQHCKLFGTGFVGQFCWCFTRSSLIPRIPQVPYLLCIIFQFTLLRLPLFRLSLLGFPKRMWIPFLSFSSPLRNIKCLRSIHRRWYE